METTEKETVSLLNDLVVINNDRIEGYKKAAEETDDIDLKALFNGMAAESRQFKAELSAEIVRLGGTVDEGTKTSGKIYRAWMDIKAALTGKDRKAIISSCEFGEDAALEEYKDVLNSDDLSPECRVIVNKQRDRIQKSHDQIKLMRDNLETT
jgi:uncharacterized protein (TIGR02284 family)